MKTQAHKVPVAVVETLNIQMKALASPYFFSLNARGTLTYFRAYAGIGGGHSVARREVFDHLYFAHKQNMDAMVETAIGQWAISATVAA